MALRSLTVRIANHGLTAVPGCRINIELVRAGKESGSVVIPDVRAEKYSNDSGLAVFELWPNDGHSRYHVKIYKPAGSKVVEGFFDMPDTDQDLDQILVFSDAGPLPGGFVGVGWTPTFAVTVDSQRTVLKVANWFGGTGTKPPINVYLGANGYVSDIAQGVDVRGAPGVGQQGVSVTGASINEDGHLILTLSNSQTIDAGLLPGSGGGVSAEPIDWDPRPVAAPALPQRFEGDLSPYTNEVVISGTNYGVSGTPGQLKLGAMIMSEGLPTDPFYLWWQPNEPTGSYAIAQNNFGIMAELSISGTAALSMEYSGGAILSNTGGAGSVVRDAAFAAGSRVLVLGNYPSVGHISIATVNSGLISSVATGLDLSVLKVGASVVGYFTSAGTLSADAGTAPDDLAAELLELIDGIPPLVGQGGWALPEDAVVGCFLNPLFDATVDGVEYKAATDAAYLKSMEPIILVHMGKEEVPEVVLAASNVVNDSTVGGAKVSNALNVLKAGIDTANADIADAKALAVRAISSTGIIRGGIMVYGNDEGGAYRFRGLREGFKLKRMIQTGGVSWQAIAISPDGRLVAYWNYTVNRVSIQDLTNGRYYEMNPGGYWFGGPGSLTFSKDSRRLYCASAYFNALYVWTYYPIFDNWQEQYYFYGVGPCGDVCLREIYGSTMAFAGGFVRHDISGLSADNRVHRLTLGSPNVSETMTIADLSIIHRMSASHDGTLVAAYEYSYTGSTGKVALFTNGDATDYFDLPVDMASNVMDMRFQPVATDPTSAYHYRLAVLWFDAADGVDGKTKLSLLAVSMVPGVGCVEIVTVESGENVIPDSIEWSPDGACLALAGPRIFDGAGITLDEVTDVPAMQGSIVWPHG